MKITIDIDDKKLEELKMIKDDTHVPLKYLVNYAIATYLMTRKSQKDKHDEK